MNLSIFLEYNKGKIDIKKIENIINLFSSKYKEIIITWKNTNLLLKKSRNVKYLLELEKKCYKKDKVSFHNIFEVNFNTVNRKVCKHLYLLKSEIIMPIKSDEYFSELEPQINKKLMMINQYSLLNTVHYYISCDCDMIEKYEEIKIFANILNLKIEYSIENVDEYFMNLVKLFDYWVNDVEGVNIVKFCSFVYNALGFMYNECVNNSCLGKGFYIYKDNIYICDKDLSESFILGNINEIKSISEVFDSEAFKSIILAGIKKRDKCLKDCKFFKNCQSGCVIDYINKKDALDCEIYQKFYDHVEKVISELLKNKTPLDKINPSLKKILLRAMTNNSDLINGAYDV